MVLDVASSRGFLRVPSWVTIAAELVTGLVLLLFAALDAAEGTGTEVALSAVGGLAVGLGLGMARHRLAAMDAEPQR